MSFGKTIIIEDDEAIQQSLIDILHDILGVSTLAAATANEGLRLVGENLPAVVLLDLTLPDESGEWVVEQAALRGWQDQVRFVILSAQSGVSDTAERLGVHAYLTKPFTLSDVIATLEAAGVK